MSQAELDKAYQQSNYASNLEQVIAGYKSGSEAARQQLGEPRRYKYGNKTIETLDVFLTLRTKAPIIIFIHGGAWRIGRAGDYAFPAPLFTEAGAHWVTPDFDSVLDVNGNLMVLASQVRNAVAWVYENAEQFNGDKNRIYVCGHSSGAHLAAVCMTTDWKSEFNLPQGFLKGGLCCSGAAAGCLMRLPDHNVRTPLSSDRQWRTALCSSLRVEHDYRPRVEGALPAGFEGRLYRNGPGLFERNGYHKQHLLDGDGMLQCFDFSAAGVHYRNRFVRTEKFIAEETAGAFIYPTWTTRAPGGTVANFGGRIKSQAGV